MNPENLNNNEDIDVMELPVEVSEQDVSNAKIETPAANTTKEAAIVEKKSFLSRLFGKTEKEQRIDAMKKEKMDTGLVEIEKNDPDRFNKYKAFQAKYGSQYAFWNEEKREYEAPTSDAVKRQ